MDNKEKMLNSFDILEIIERLIRFQNDGKGTVFFELMGHVDSIFVKVYLPAWAAGYEPTYSAQQYIHTDDDGFTAERLTDFKNKIFAFLDTH